ncbi:MAG: hypothetical protein ACOCRX_12540 [Candidatus Woesearchaeota archaeon]
MILGFVLGKINKVSLTKLSQIGKNLADPITIKIHKWSRKYKMRAIKNQRWLILFLLIFLNNLLLAAFIIKIVYGIIFFIPLLLTAWEGFSHGVLFSKPKGRAGIILTFFEFGGYLFATTIGVNMGIQLLLSMLKNNQIKISFSWRYFIPLLLFLFTGALIESFSMKVVSKNADLSDVDKIDFEKRRKKMAEYVDEGD